MCALPTSKQNKTDDLELTIVTSSDPTTSKERNKQIHFKDETVEEIGEKKVDATSTTSEEIDEHKKKDVDKSKEDDKADGYDPFSQDTFRPFMSGNQYSVRKTASQALIDVALMMANISQLRTLLTAGDTMEYSAVLIALVALSLAFQMIFAILIFIIWMRESDQHQKDDYLNTLREVTETSNGTITTTAKDKIRNSLLRRQISFKDHKITSHLNYATMVLVFIITIINMFITGFGIKLESSTNPTLEPTTA